MNKSSILVIARQHIPKQLLTHGFIPTSEKVVLELLDNQNLTFLERNLAENDPTFKQLIPYVVIQSPAGVFNYQRGSSSSESRLRMLRSLGVGGHIEKEDGGPENNTYWKGLWRELHEEVGLKPSINIKILGFINDDTNEVGKVHLGIVHLLTLESNNIASGEHNLVDCKFSFLNEIIAASELFEPWSRILLPYLEF